MADRINRHFFFEFSRLNLFDGRLSKSQVSGLNAILEFWETQYSRNDDRFLAYALGTAHHETGRTMQPIKEWGTEEYFRNMYDIAGERPLVAKRLGNTQPGDGIRFCGRGFVQITGRSNYATWSHRLGLDLEGEPDLAMNPAVASEILLGGMIDGKFTGKRLSDYFSGLRADWNNARRIVNGTDKAQLVGSYARTYYGAISYTTN